MKYIDFSWFRITSIFVLAISLMLSSLALGPQERVVAQEGPSCQWGFYQHSQDDSTDGLRLFDPVPGTFPLVGDESDASVIGYNSADDMLYGLNSSEDLVRLDPMTGELEVLNSTPLTNQDGSGNTLSDEFVNSGIHSEFTLGDVHDGFLYAIVGGRDIGDVETDEQIQQIRDVFKVDLSAMTYEKLSIAYDEVVFPDGDLVYFEGKLYIVDGQSKVRETTYNAKLVVIDLEQQTATVVKEWNNADLPRWYVYGSQWLAQDEATGEYRLFAYHDRTGEVYELDDFTTGDPIVTKVHDGTDIVAAGNDGATCPETPIPNFVINAEDDSTQVDRRGAVAVDVTANDQVVEDQTIVMCNADGVDLSPQFGSVMLNDDGILEYTPDDDFVGLDSFTYTICNSRSTSSDSATVEVEVLSASLSVTVDDGEDTASVGSVLTSTITVTNEGPGTSFDLTVTYEVPVSVSRVAGSDGGVFDDASGVVTFPVVDSLASGEVLQYTVSYEVDTDAPAQISGIANVSDDMENQATDDDDTVIEGDSGETGQVLGASDTADDGTDDVSSDQSASDTDGQVQGDKQVLAETGNPAVMMIIVGATLIFLAIGLQRLVTIKIRK